MLSTLSRERERSFPVVGVSVLSTESENASNLAPLCSSSTSQNTAGNDHFPVLTSIGGTFIKKCIFTYKIRINSKDISLLNHSLNDSFSNFESNVLSGAINTYQYFNAHIRQHVFSLFSRESRAPRSCVLHNIFHPHSSGTISAKPR